MIEVKNQFARHTIFWWVGMPLVVTLCLPMFLPSASFLISPEEVEFFAEMGVDTGAASTAANEWFHSLFIDTGIQKFFHSTFVNANMTMTNHLQDLGRKTTSGWNSGFWNMLFRAIWRLIALWPVYLAGCLAFVIPSFIDGLTARAKKKYNYEVHNPVFFYASTHFAVLIMGLAVFLPFLPIALNVMYLGAFFGVLAASMWVLASNFQSGV